jgi:hypothetical protein
LAQEALYVFDKHSHWLRLANGTDHFWEKISLVILALMLAALRPWLARNAAGQQLNINAKIGVSK